MSSGSGEVRSTMSFGAMDSTSAHDDGLRMHFTMLKPTLFFAS